MSKQEPTTGQLELLREMAQESASLITEDTEANGYGGVYLGLPNFPQRVLLRQLFDGLRDDGWIRRAGNRYHLGRYRRYGLSDKAIEYLKKEEARHD